MINSISSSSDYWYQQSKNRALEQIIAAAANQESFLSPAASTDASEAVGSGSAMLSMEDLMGMMQSTGSSASVSAQEEETSEDSEECGISSVDADGDGTISADEYETLISQMGIEDALSAEKFFAQYDTNDDGEISSAEMSAKDADRTMMPPPMGPPPEEAQGLSSEIDTDGNGSLSSDEYESMISQLGVQDALSTEDFFSRYDTNEDGEISPDEVTAMKENTEQNLTAEADSLANSTIRAYETNYQYMFDEENSYWNSIA